MSIFIGGPLDGKEDFEVPPNLKNEVLIPWFESTAGEYRSGTYIYRFDGLAWRYAGMRE
jgi:hypothetical protein